MVGQFSSSGKKDMHKKFNEELNWKANTWKIEKDVVGLY
jgi:hypothetical protein